MVDYARLAIEGAGLLQDSIQGAMHRTPGGSIGEGILVEDAPVTTAGTNIAHKLGRKMRGAIVVLNSAGTTFKIERGSPDTQFVRVTPGANCTISLWVF